MRNLVAIFIILVITAGLTGGIMDQLGSPPNDVTRLPNKGTDMANRAKFVTVNTATKTGMDVVLLNKNPGSALVDNLRSNVGTQTQSQLANMIGDGRLSGDISHPEQLGLHAAAGGVSALIKDADPWAAMVSAPVSEAAAEAAFMQGFKPEAAADIGKIAGSTSGLVTGDVGSASESAITAIDNNFLPMAIQVARTCAMSPACVSLVRDGMAVATAAAITIYKGKNPNAEGFDIADVKNKLPGFTPETSEASVVTTPIHEEGIKTFVTPVYEQDQSEYLEGFTTAPDWLRYGWLVLNNDDFQEISNKDINMKFGGGIQEQGMPWEDYLATQLADNTRLPAGFKTFDFFDHKERIATSAKTMDTLTISKLDKPEQIYSALKRYINKTASFEEAKLGVVKVSADKIDTRKIELAIPTNTTAEQYKQIEKAIEYAKDNGIELNITRVK